ncbi:hypothetical protein CFD26_102916 [Aspergillus turcosus]|uniref:Aminoglycoside phosphotransferase domain-containing protein n=1 Tax=Aspergillus turcosus TaxID=1245748 RepID=A0A3R7JBW1_9EURO|nr:hypothetical protein CFD26_102916 [Aspergillus turcosus]
MARKTKQWELKEEDRFGAHEMIHVYKVDPKTVVKLIEPPRLSEAETLRFVRSKTSIPVPEVYDAYVDESIARGVIVMEYIEGDVLQDVWEDMAEEEQEGIISQLRGYMEELRSIKGDFIGSIDKSSCEDPIFTSELGSFGPYADEDEFNEGIIRAMGIAEGHLGFAKRRDLTPRNILVRGGRVVGIIDWEMAGFFPEYWEYVKALCYPDWERVCGFSILSLGFPSAREDGESKRLGGFIGMSGWLPFEGEIAGLLKIDEGDEGESESEAEEDDDDPFAHDTDGDNVPAHIQAVNHIRDILGMPPFQSDANDSENALRV